MSNQQRNRANKSKSRPKRPHSKSATSRSNVASSETNDANVKEPSLSKMMMATTSTVENDCLDAHSHQHRKSKKRRVEVVRNAPKKVVTFENPEKMGSRRLNPSNKVVADVKDKRGASIAFRDKYNQYLDSRMEKDDLNVDLVRNLPLEDLYSRNEDDMSDDEKQARFWFETDVDATVAKYKKAFESRPRETISSMNERKRLEQDDRKHVTFYVAGDGGENDNGDNGDDEEKVAIEGDRANEVEVVKTVVVLGKPFYGSTSTLSSRDFVELKINTNPYPFLYQWSDMQRGTPARDHPKFIICVQLDAFVKTKLEGFRIYKTFFTSKRYLTLNMFFDGLRPMPIVVSPSSMPRKRSKSHGRADTNSKNDSKNDVRNVDDTSKNDAIVKFNDAIEKECGYLIKRTYHHVISDVYLSIEGDRATTQRRRCNVSTADVESSEDSEDGEAMDATVGTHCNFACTTFEKTFLSEDLNVIVYVYYKLDLKERKISIFRVFYVLINLR